MTCLTSFGELRYFPNWICGPDTGRYGWRTTLSTKLLSELGMDRTKALAIVIAFKACRCYLEGRRTTVYTDHCSLKYLKTQPNLSRRQVRWIDFLETHFHYDIVYKPGHKNKADALSRSAHVAAIQIEGMNPLLKGLFTHGASNRRKRDCYSLFLSQNSHGKWLAWTSSLGYHLPPAVMMQSLSSSTSSPKWDTSSRHTRQHASRRQHNYSFDTSSHSMAFQPHLSPTGTPSSPASSGRNSCLCSDQTRHVVRLPSADRRTDRAPQPSCRATPLSSLQGRNLQMGLAPARSRVCLQQRYTCRYWTDAVLPLLRTPPTHTTETDDIRYTTWKIHNAFHVQLLKPYRDLNTIFVGRQPPPPPPPVLVRNEPEYEVESVLAHRRRRNGTVELLIRWKGYDPSEDSWVPETDMGNARRPLHDYLVKQGVTSTTQL
ncbi:hypothetical protein CLOM_g24376 [Closterium sp. NIES-68]|nr:hypothetical protein CLOM_g24376 [Closterium sp. NIES-68]